jgi:hypothetical protein
MHELLSYSQFEGWLIHQAHAMIMFRDGKKTSVKCVITH